MIRGIGTDLADLARIEGLLDGPLRERFLKRVLTPAERRLLEDRPLKVAELLAGRFAAKEAVAKALGCGIGASLGFHDIEILPDAGGKPVCRLTDRARAANGVGEGDRIHVSISHAGGMAAAFAVWEQQR